MISFKLLTKPSTGHNPYFVSSGQCLSGESGTGASFTITRIWGPGVEAHDKTERTTIVKLVIGKASESEPPHVGTGHWLRKERSRA